MRDPRKFKALPLAWKGSGNSKSGRDGCQALARSSVDVAGSQREPQINRERCGGTCRDSFYGQMPCVPIYIHIYIHACIHDMHIVLQDIYIYTYNMHIYTYMYVITENQYVYIFIHMYT